MPDIPIPLIPKNSPLRYMYVLNLPIDIPSFSVQNLIKFKSSCAVENDNCVLVCCHKYAKNSMKLFYVHYFNHKHDDILLLFFFQNNGFVLSSGV